MAKNYYPVSLLSVVLDISKAFDTGPDTLVFFSNSNLMKYSVR